MIGGRGAAERGDKLLVIAEIIGLLSHLRLHRGVQQLLGRTDRTARGRINQAAVTTNLTCHCSSSDCEYRPAACHAASQVVDCH